jgi:4-carboxymuconolactone decarboxylase
VHRVLRWAHVPTSSHEGDGIATARQLPADVYPETLSRLPPLKRETLNEAQQKAYDAVSAPRSGRLNLAGIKGPGGVILRMPKLAKPLGDVNRVLRSELGLDARLVELTILATAREMQSQFEWAMHEPVALEVGVAAATIDMIRHGKPLADVPEKEAALIHLAREAVAAKQVTPATYATALTLFGEEELLHYSVLIASTRRRDPALHRGAGIARSPVAGIAGAGKAMKCCEGETRCGMAASLRRAIPHRM